MKKKTFENVLQEHKDRVYSYSLYFLKNREDAEDVTQEVFVRYWKNQDNIKKKKVMPWLLTVAHHRCIDLIRQKRASISQQRMTSAMELDHIPHKNDSMTDPEIQMECSETKKKIMDAMEFLPERTRSILLLHYFQGLKYEELSEMLDTKVSTIKVAAHRGKRILKDVLMESFPERMVM